MEYVDMNYTINEMRKQRFRFLNIHDYVCMYDKLYQSCGCGYVIKLYTCGPYHIVNQLLFIFGNGPQSQSNV